MLTIATATAYVLDHFDMYEGTPDPIILNAFMVDHVDYESCTVMIDFEGNEYAFEVWIEESSNGPRLYGEW
jgi:hypothetical protein